MKKFTLALATLLLFAPIWGQAQSQRPLCGTSEHMQKLIAADPSYAQRMQEIEAQTASFVQAGGNKTEAVVTIPVVVHVVYNNATENISDAQIQSQIAVLNKDFGRTNTDANNTPAVWSGIAANTQIQFCLAIKDPSGAATTGITRTSTATTSFTDNDAVKSNGTGGKTGWDATKYLNLWVCDLGTQLLGYAQFPGGPTSTDGVVIHYLYFGTSGTATAPYNLGRTASHEVGHWLNLFHIWGDDCGNGNGTCSSSTECSGSDGVADTPNQCEMTYGTFPVGTVRTDGCTSSSPGVMWQNYMDYSDDIAMNFFTNGQSTRMNALLVAGGARFSLTSSQGCSTGTNYCSASGSSTADEWIQSVVLTGVLSNTSGNNGGYGNFTTVNYTVVKGAAYSFTLTPGFSGSSYPEYWRIYIDYNNDKDFLDAGELAYDAGTTSTTARTGSITIPATAATAATRMRVMMKYNGAPTSCETFPYGEVEDYTLNITVGSCTDTYEANETQATAKTIAVNTNILAKICTATDIDYFKFTTLSSAPKVRINLTTLPADYDVILYNSAGVQIGSSANGGTTSEQIIYNTATTGATYYVRVFGFNGVFNTTLSYTLRANTSSANFRMSDEGETRDSEKPEVTTAIINSMVFPNPTSGELNVAFSSEFELPAAVSLVDMLGRVIEMRPFTSTAGNNAVRFDVSNLESGIYLVNIQVGESSHTMRVNVTR